MVLRRQVGSSAGIIQRHLGKAQRGELEYLLHSPDDRAGALGFGLDLFPGNGPFLAQGNEAPDEPKASQP